MIESIFKIIFNYVILCGCCLRRTGVSGISGAGVCEQSDMSDGTKCGSFERTVLALNH